MPVASDVPPDHPAREDAPPQKRAFQRIVAMVATATKPTDFSGCKAPVDGCAVGIKQHFGLVGEHAINCSLTAIGKLDRIVAGFEFGLNQAPVGLNVIDFEALQLRTPHVVHDLPAGGLRFLQNADGIEATIVSGEVIYQNGEATGALPGKLVRGSQSDPRASAA